jgi:hypothetical protein
LKCCVSSDIIVIERTDKAITKVGYAAGLSNDEVIDPYALKLWSTNAPLPWRWCAWFTEAPTGLTAKHMEQELRNME